MKKLMTICLVLCAINPVLGSKSQIFYINYKSSLDNTFQPLLVKLPENYTCEKKWPLLMVLHGLGDGPIIVDEIDSMIQIGPKTRDYKMTSTQADKCLEFASKIFSVDPNQFFLAGFSMGAIATFEIGLSDPNTYAACVPVCGRLDDFSLIENGTNLPFWIHTGREDTVVPPDNAREVFTHSQTLYLDHWRYTEHENMSHSFNINWKDVEQWLIDQRKTPNSQQQSVEH